MIELGKLKINTLGAVKRASLKLYDILIFFRFNDIQAARLSTIFIELLHPDILENQSSVETCLGLSQQGGITRLHLLIKCRVNIGSNPSVIRFFDTIETDKKNGESGKEDRNSIRFHGIKHFPESSYYPPQNDIDKIEEMFSQPSKEELLKNLLAKNKALKQSTKEILAEKEKTELATEQLQKQVDELARARRAMFNIMDDLDEAKKVAESATQESKKAEVALAMSHKKIIDSIEFASMIQNAFLPDRTLLSEFFEDSFAVWQPKDVVGGDIYFWDILRNKNELLMLVIDCTGHGVPGAIVTAIVKAVQIQVTAEALVAKGEISPSKILSFFNIKLKTLLKQENSDASSNAGFDGGVLYFDRERKIVKYAGAETPLFYIQDGELTMIKGDRQSIGYKKSKPYFLFKEHTIALDKETCFYITTDGFLDQNGGKKGYPFGKKKFKQMLLDNYQKSFDQQEKIYLDTIDQYRDKEEKTDDLTFVGLSFG